MDDDNAEGSQNQSLVTRIFIACSHLFRLSDGHSKNMQHSGTTSPHKEVFAGQAESRVAKQVAGEDKMQSMDGPSTPLQRSLHEIVEDNSFWNMGDLDVLRVIKSEFPYELERLKRATFVRDSNAPRPEGPSISDALYGQDYAEINRTLVGVLALRWIHNDEYQRFVKTQGPPSIVLKPESFASLRRVFEKGLQTTEDIYTLITSMVTNDLGKDPNLATDYCKKVGIDISKVNHDMILYHAVNKGMVPSLDRLTKKNKGYLIQGIKLGRDFNFGQLAQAENAPASLSGLLEMRGHKHAFQMRFMEQILDLAGAAGHEDWTCAKKMIEPIFQSYKNVYDVANGIISRDMPCREGYDIILNRKLELLHRAGYSRQFDISKPADRALMRLFCLGNTSNTETADVFFTAFTKRISAATREQLVHGLNVDGSVQEPAVQPTYIPAMMTKALGSTVNGSPEEKTDAITAMLRYLGRCLTIDPSILEKLPHGVTVIERDVKKIIPVLDSDGFKRNPDVLDQESLPDEQVANIVSSP